jgi:cytochrome c peroxidase
MAVPADNPISDAKVALGRRLFFDKRLSGNQEQSCASCHEPALAFSDGEVVPSGSTGQKLPRNAPSLANVGYLPVLTWVNPLLRSLEEQAMVPLFADIVIELGATYHEQEILGRLATDEEYPKRFAAAFQGQAEPVTWENAIKALATFERTFISGGSPFDRYTAGDTGALSSEAKQGLELFNGERLECYHCHAGFNFTTAVRTASGESWRGSFVNTGLYNLDAHGGYPESNPGLSEITDDPADTGQFRIPSLRNVALTAPYMHDGSIADLDGVIDHYARGGRLIAEGVLAGDGAKNPNKDILIGGFELSTEERAGLLAFLNSLTDVEFLTNPAHSDPFERDP